jgi:antitoxin ChpS
MLAVPPAILELLHLKAGSAVGVSVDEGRLIIEAQANPHYTLSELLAASDYTKPQPEHEREWVDAPAIGREVI